MRSAREASVGGSGHRLKGKIPRIVTLLENWRRPKITWRAVVEHVETELGFRFSRQALEAQEDILDAYHAAKDRLRKGGPPPARRRSEAERIAALEAQNRSLREENDQLIEKFVRWERNASKHGLREDQLEKPLPVGRLSSDYRAERRKQKEAEKAKQLVKRQALVRAV
ncbi:hypothetical protein AB7M16_003361 [Bradyrhizobium sp. USDA 372]